MGSLVNAGADRRRLPRLGSTDLMMLLAVIIWGINFTAVKVALVSISPMAFNAIRFSLATAVMLLVLWLHSRAGGQRGQFGIRGRDWPAMAFLGLTGHAVYQLMFANGMSLATPANASLLIGTAPIWVAMLGYLLGVERINRVMWAGILLSFAGIALVISSGGQVRLTREMLAGNALLIGSAILWAIYTTASKPLLGRYSALQLTAWSMLFGTIPLVLIGIPASLAQDWGAVPAIAWLGLAYSVLLSVAVGYIIWSTSVQRVGNARTAVFANLTPVVTILFAWLTIGSKLSLLQLAGGAVVLAGLMVTRRGRTAGPKRDGAAV